MGVHKLIVYDKGKYNLQNFLRINFGKKNYSKYLEKLSIHISTFKRPVVNGDSELYTRNEEIQSTSYAEEVLCTAYSEAPYFT